MSGKRQRKRCAESARRFRTLARSLRARIYAAGDGRLLLVGEQPDFHRLAAGLRRLRDVPSPPQSPTPVELGFSVTSDGELTAYGLNVRGQALTRWSRAVECQLHSRGVKKGERRKLVVHQQEIERLGQRLGALHHWLRASQSDHNFASAYLLEPCEEDYVAQQIATLAGGGGQLPLLARFHARVAYWIAGPLAVDRYVRSVAPLAEQHARNNFADLVRGFEQRLHIWKRRSRTEHDQQLFFELKQAIAQFPPELARRGQFTSRRRGRKFEQLCDTLIDRSRVLLGELCDGPTRAAAATMAALAACDDGYAPLPRYLVGQCLADCDTTQLSRRADWLIDEARRPGYNALLETLDQLPHPPDHSEYEQVRTMVHGGATADQIAWAQKHSLIPWFDQACLRPAWVRNWWDRLREHGIAFTDPDVRSVLNGVKHPKDVAALDRFFRWVFQFAAGVVDTKLGAALRKTLLEVVAPALEESDCHDILHVWARPPRSKRRTRAIAELDALQQPWLAGVFFYQRMAGQRPRVPKSLRGLREAQARRRNEQRYLERLANEGEATPGQRMRLAHLVGQGPYQCRGKDARRVRQVLIATALAALRAALLRRAQQRWQRASGAPLPNVSLRRAFGFLQWVNNMDAQQQAILRDVLAAHREHGCRYRDRLPRNQDWLAQTRRRGVNMDAWIRPRPNTLTIGGRRVRIYAGDDPLAIFQMGNYFDTCLSFGGENQMSVLANAYDANKQVVWMASESGSVLGRKLVALSPKFELLGYYCYLNIESEQSEIRRAYEHALDAYCGAWARRVGAALGNSGQPQPIGNHFWYDDGLVDWGESAQMAWNRSPAAAPVAMAESDAPNALWALQA